MKKSIIFEVGIVRILVVILQLFFLKAYSNNTTLYELGVYYFLFTLSYSLNAFVLVPLDYFQQSKIYTLKENGNSLRSFIGVNIWVLKLIFLILCIGVVILLLLNIEYITTLIVIVLLATSTYLVNLTRGLINNLENRRVAIYSLLFESILKVGFYYLYMYFFKSSSKVILCSILSSSLISFALLYYLISRLEDFKNRKVQSFSRSEILKFSYPISLSAVVNWIQLQGYRMILVPFGLVEVVGIYGTVSNVGTNGMNAFSTIYSQLFIPNLYKTQGKYLKTYILYALLSIFGVLVVSYFLSDLIVSILTSQKFVKYSAIILFGVVSEAGNFLIGGLTVYLTIKNLTYATMKSTLTGLFVFLISFAALYATGNVNVFTIGIPIILTQLVITGYLAYIIYTENKKLIL
ncbi:hypothetical protein [Pedobacter mendelii]|uniref:Polysaccharide biosynthesis protein n=1 Tax=Pedobacter mendelii TaxID=1908240 RepID=A0ABQ2BN63_9SPHI|nr:hypothetical protein [Pedobacter mendelii]GGI28255.1 hypothetical protein GCM10008119_31730 [Pedobacter mendelii]